MEKHQETESKRHMDLSRSLSLIDNKIDALYFSGRANRFELEKLQSQRESIVAQLDRLTPGRITVTDHALIRYIERVMKVDLDMVRNQIFTDAQKQIVGTLKSCILPIGAGHSAVIRNQVVVTVLPEKKNSSRQTRVPKSSDYKKRQQALDRAQ